MSLFLVFKVVNGTRLGTTILNSRGIFAEAKWYWIGVGALIGFILLFNLLYTLCLAFLKREYHIPSDTFISHL